MDRSRTICPPGAGAFVRSPFHQLKSRSVRGRVPMRIGLRDDGDGPAFRGSATLTTAGPARLHQPAGRCDKWYRGRRLLGRLGLFRYQRGDPGRRYLRRRGNRPRAVPARRPGTLPRVTGLHPFDHRRNPDGVDPNNDAPGGVSRRIRYERTGRRARPSGRALLRGRAGGSRDPIALQSRRLDFRATRRRTRAGTGRFHPRRIPGPQGVMAAGVGFDVRVGEWPRVSLVAGRAPHDPAGPLRRPSPKGPSPTREHDHPPGRKHRRDVCSDFCGLTWPAPAVLEPIRITAVRLAASSKGPPSGTRGEAGVFG